MANLESVVETYGIDSTSASIEVISSGLINPTWKIVSPEGDFILQRINTSVFREPELLAKNCHWDVGLGGHKPRLSVPSYQPLTYFPITY
jgi:hypothetical protein